MDFIIFFINIIPLSFQIILVTKLLNKQLLKSLFDEYLNFNELDTRSSSRDFLHAFEIVW